MIFSIGAFDRSLSNNRCVPMESKNYAFAVSDKFLLGDAQSLPSTSHSHFSTKNNSCNGHSQHWVECCLELPSRFKQVDELKLRMAWNITMTLRF